MKIFISWSGKRSRALANALRDWLPLVLQYVEPWVSDKDIAAGDRWAQAIGCELESSNFGIICITPENVSSEWILFEAGALSKSMLDGKVIPLLFGLEQRDLSGPLSQFQAQKVEEPGLMEVVKSINKVAQNKALDAIITQLVPTLWPTLLTELEKIPNKEKSEGHARPQQEILEELVTSVRGLSTRMRDFDPEFLSRSGREYKRKSRWLHPILLEEIIHALPDREDHILSLLIIAGMIRHDFPWLAEILTESYRELRDGKCDNAELVLFRLQCTLKPLMRGPFMEEMTGGSKEAYILARELPRLVDMAIRPALKSIASSEKSDKGVVEE